MLIWAGLTLKGPRHGKTVKTTVGWHASSLLGDTVALHAPVGLAGAPLLGHLVPTPGAVLAVQPLVLGALHVVPVISYMAGSRKAGPQRQTAWGVARSQQQQGPVPHTATIRSHGARSHGTQRQKASRQGPQPAAAGPQPASHRDLDRWRPPPWRLPAAHPATSHRPRHLLPAPWCSPQCILAHRRVLVHTFTAGLCS